MSDDLSNRGIYFDDIYVLRVLDPEITSETHDLRSESTEYVNQLNEFQKITKEFIKTTEKFAKEVDAHKMRAIGVKNLLKSISKQRQTEQRNLQAKILERKTELERLKIEYHYLQRILSEQQEIIANFHET
ncbi:Intraflagellar transport protein 20 like [Pseudolycoriella hygida]|uniref:Intraflagellar transport protein 20 like n=1 Tax=Pseudolycoriella hygida TaxID=35572 RepID=A0A9Q0S6Q5_9DIPT|nr:Intraflagellar transport protein 20 like [Pseudolycoriella hygida]